MNEQTQKNIAALVEIRDNPDTTAAVRIQAIQTLQKIIDSAGTAEQPRKDAKAIMQEIRSKRAT